MNTYFWFVAGMLTGFSAALVGLPLLRGARSSLAHRNVRIALAVAGAAAFGTVALVLYRTFGSPQMLSEHVAAIPPPHPGLQISASKGSADSMESAVARLEARVAREGGKRDDWLLLAQSYDFMGRVADAQRARERAGSADASAPASMAAVSGNAAARPVSAKESAAEYERRASADSRDADAWRALAGTYRQQHHYVKARDAFANLARLNAMSADTWADYADVLASLSGGSLQGEASRAIDRALELDGLHPKALWLKASLAHEQRRYADALTVWRQLRAALPSGSPDVRIVDANIVEAAELAGLSTQPATQAARTSAASAAAPSAEVSGTVSIDRKLAARVSPGATLFIYAKAADSPGPPLAVLRQKAGTWPVTFRLDDTLAMLPTRRLSQFDKVIVEARVSRSGEATPASGDLYVRSEVLTPANRRKVSLIIDHEVG